MDLVLKKNQQIKYNKTPNSLGFRVVMAFEIKK